MTQFQLGLNTSTIRPAGLMDKIQIASETGYYSDRVMERRFNGLRGTRRFAYGCQKSTR